MQFDFKTGNVSVYPNGQVALLVNLPKEYRANVNELNELVESDQLKSLEVKIFKEKRSLSANSYMWQLLDKLSKKLNTTSEELYIEYLKNYGVHDYFAGLETIKPSLERMYKIVEIKKDCTINETKAVTFKAILGTSKYDKLEMAKFIDHVVEDCKTQGIQTMTPKEIEMLIERWENETLQPKKRWQ